MIIKKVENPEEFRANIVKKLNKFFENEKNSSNLEKGIYNWTIKECNNRKIIKKWDNPYFIQIYIDHCRSIYINLTKNPYLIEQVKNDEIKSHEIAFMTHQEIEPKRWEELINKKSLRDKAKFEDKLEANTDTFICRKCKSNKCYVYSMQVRSADEPETLYITCTICGKKWKFN